MRTDQKNIKEYEKGIFYYNPFKRKFDRELKRGLKVDQWMLDNIPFYPDDPTSQVGIGFDFAVHCLSRHRTDIPSLSEARMCGEYFLNFLKRQNTKATKLLRRLENLPESRCVIM